MRKTCNKFQQVDFVIYDLGGWGLQLSSPLPPATTLQNCVVFEQKKEALRSKVTWSLITFSAECGKTTPFGVLAYQNYPVLRLYIRMTRNIDRNSRKHGLIAGVEQTGNIWNDFLFISGSFRRPFWADLIATMLFHTMVRLAIFKLYFSCYGLATPFGGFPNLRFYLQIKRTIDLTELELMRIASTE